MPKTPNSQGGRKAVRLGKGPEQKGCSRSFSFLLTEALLIGKWIILSTPWALRTAKMALRYFAKYNIIKIKGLKSTEGPFGGTGKSNKEVSHNIEGLFFLLCLLAGK